MKKLKPDTIEALTAIISYIKDNQEKTAAEIAEDLDTTDEDVIETLMDTLEDIYGSNWVSTVPVD